VLRIPLNAGVRKCEHERRELIKLGGFMGRLSGTESAIALIVAFIDRRTWSQTELAAHLEIKVAAVRARIGELQAAGVPLERDEDHPHVYWSVPKGWVPGAIKLTPRELGDLLRVLRRAPDDSARAQVLARILEAQGAGCRSEAPGAVAAPTLPDEAAMYLAVLEDAARHREALRIRYLAAYRNAVGYRDVSPHQVQMGPPMRMYATCHSTGELRNFRVDRVLNAKSLGRAEYRPADPVQLQAFIDTSVNGFRAPESAELVAFHVRNPEAQWVQSNLPSGLQSEVTKTGIRVYGTVAANVQVARFVVSLGGAATAETAALRAIVCDLARESLNNHLSDHAEPERVSSDGYLVAADSATNLSRS
jgi:predicted DNA-binding transcriptional regulator YafY